MTTGLQAKVAHDCDKPTPPTVEGAYRWTCPVCASTWAWYHGERQRLEREKRGRFRRVTVEYREPYGYWFAMDRTHLWVDVDEHGVPGIADAWKVQS